MNTYYKVNPIKKICNAQDTIMPDVPILSLKIKEAARDEKLSDPDGYRGSYLSF